jgi:hypothetical protein
MMAVWIRETEWQTATLSAVAHSKGQKKIVFPPAGPGYSQLFHSPFLKEG